MRKPWSIAGAVAATMFMGVSIPSFAASPQDGQTAVSPTQSVPVFQPNGGGGGGGGGRGGRGGQNGGQNGGGRGGQAGQFGRNSLQTLITAVGEADLSPDFNLSTDQKTKIQAVRDDLKKQTAQWRTDHADDIKKLDDAVAEIRQSFQNGGQQADRQAAGQKMRDLNTQRQTLMASAPKSDDAVAQIMAILSDDQKKMLETFKAERQKEIDEARAAFGGGFGGGAGGAGGGRGGRGGGGGGAGGGGAGGGGAGGGGAGGGAGGGGRGPGARGV